MAVSVAIWISRRARSIILSASSLAAASIRRFTTSASRRPSSTMAEASPRAAASFCSYSLSRASAASRSCFAFSSASRMKLSRVWRVLRIGPQANLPRTTSTTTKISSVQTELPRSPANRLGASPPSSAASAGTAIIVIAATPATANSARLIMPASQRSQQSDDDGEQRGAFDQRRGDDHRRADLAGGLGLACHRLDRAAADAADARGTADDGEAGADGAAQLAGALGGQEVGVLGRTRSAGGRLRVRRGHGGEHQHEAEGDHRQREPGSSLAHRKESFPYG